MALDCYNVREAFIHIGFENIGSGVSCGELVTALELVYPGKWIAKDPGAFVRDVLQENSKDSKKYLDNNPDLFARIKRGRWILREWRNVDFTPASSPGNGDGPRDDHNHQLDDEVNEKEKFAQEVDKMVKLPFAELIARLNAVSTSSASMVLIERIKRFERSPLVAAYAKIRSAFRCEVPSCIHPTFEGKDGRTYGEIHHIEPLAEGGADVIANVANICPAHHREAHYGKCSETIKATLLKIRST